jgi:hypothetical protein
MLAFLAKSNADRRERELRHMPDIMLSAYWERVTTNIAATPDSERDAMAAFDQGELQATEAEMLRRGMHPKRTPPPSTQWRLPRTAWRRGASHA